MTGRAHTHTHTHTHTWRREKIGGGEGREQRTKCRICGKAMLRSSLKKTHGEVTRGRAGEYLSGSTGKGRI